MPLLTAKADPGQINFLNGPIPAVQITLSNPLSGTSEPLPTTPGAFQFQLFVAPANTANPLDFAPTNVRGTNITAAPGRMFGGIGVQTETVLAGEHKAILVRGWSTSLGNEYDVALQNWLVGEPGYFGTSAIAPDFIFGGFDGTGPIPASTAFAGAFGIQSGFALVAIPEPTVFSMLLGGGIYMFFRRKPARY